MPDPMDSLFNFDEPITQEQIRELRKNGLTLLSKAVAMQQLAQARLKMAKELCDHPNKKGFVCPDCGFDNGPDGW